MAATPDEIEAVRLRHGYLNPGGPAEPTAEEFETLLRDVRSRAQEIESESLEMLNQRLREGRRFPMRHQRFAGALLLLLLAILAIVYPIRN